MLPIIEGADPILLLIGVFATIIVILLDSNA
jgi:hypothetical protein